MFIIRSIYRDGQICEDCVHYGLKCAVKYACYRGSKIQTLACVLSTCFHRMTGIYGKINYICLTEFNKKKLLELKQIKSERVFVKPNFVESKVDFIPEGNRKDQFVFAGRLDKLKGIDILFEVWKCMCDTAPKLVVCGTGAIEKWCKEFIRQNRVNIELRGFVANKKILELIANSKALILPTQCYEGFPMSIVEAFSVGTPVVCSNLGNAGSIVEEGVTGYKFQADSIEDIISAVRRCEGMCESTMNKFNIKYTDIKNYEIIKNIYMRIFSGWGYNINALLYCTIVMLQMLNIYNVRKQVLA